MTSRKNWLEVFKKISGREVVRGNNIAYRVDGFGKIILKLENGYIYTFERVRYVPELNRNLISMGNFDDIGLQSKIGDGFLKVIKCSLVILKGIKRNEIYLVKANTVGNDIAESSSAKLDATLKWRKRQGHVSEKSLQILHKKGVFGKDPIAKMSF